MSEARDFDVRAVRGVDWILPDADRIAAARWAAHNLLLGRLVGLSPAGWIHRDTKGGAIFSQLGSAPRKARRR